MTKLSFLVISDLITHKIRDLRNVYGLTDEAMESDARIIELNKAQDELSRVSSKLTSALRREEDQIILRKVNIEQMEEYKQRSTLLLDALKIIRKDTMLIGGDGDSALGCINEEVPSNMAQIAIKAIEAVGEQ